MYMWQVNKWAWPGVHWQSTKLCHFVFLAVLQGYAAEVESHDSKHSRDTPSAFSGHMGAGLGPRHYTVHLRAVLLLQFMEHLDKLMYNAYEGSCVTLPPVPKVMWFL